MNLCENTRAFSAGAGAPFVAQADCRRRFSEGLNFPALPQNAFV
jgi:hypothetical protein